MIHNQLFCEEPTMDLIIELLKCYGLSSLNDNIEFSKADLCENKTVEKMEDMIHELIMYYLPCKAKIYLDVITEKRAITILSQFIKLFSYKLARKERIINKRKVIFYRIQKIEDTKLHIDNSSTYQLLF
jgi:hypothetical protein|uniref:Uncharacterized protein n=1 Tax=viral metagenome TaxID=1070528 RepID=A0A6C0BR62_9ZZZZ